MGYMYIMYDSLKRKTYWLLVYYFWIQVHKHEFSEGQKLLMFQIKLLENVNITCPQTCNSCNKHTGKIKNHKLTKTIINIELKI
jgi:hypothetical protein